MQKYIGLVCSSLFIILLWFSGHARANVLAAVDDPTDVPFFLPGKTAESLLEEVGRVDSGLVNLQRYALFYDRDIFYAGKGNIGHDGRIMRFYTPSNQDLAFFSRTLNPGQILTHKNTKFYRPKHVYTELFYITGSENEQLFRVTHHQRFRPDLVGGFIYRVINSPGRYSRMDARNLNVGTSVDYFPSERYHLVGNFLYNRIENQESGGLSNRLNFEQDAVRDSVVLYDANSRHRDVAFHLSQFFDPFYSEHLNGDSLKQDSRGGFRHDFSIRRRDFIFDQASPPHGDYFGETLWNEAFTYDSTRVFTMQNALSWSNMKPEGRVDAAPLLGLNLSLEHRFENIHNTTTLPEDAGDIPEADLAHRYSTFQPSFLLRFNPSQRMTLSLGADYSLGGYQDKDVRVNARIALANLIMGGDLHLLFAFSQKEVPYFLNHYYSNYVRWNNDFEKTGVFHSGVKFSGSGFGVALDYYHIARAVSIGFDAKPFQHGNDFSVFAAAFSITLPFGSRFGSDHHLLYQYIGDDFFERLPGLSGVHSMYADFTLFDRALVARGGFDVRFNTPYKPMEYMPVTRQFYIQDHYETNHVVMLDAFLNARISRARLFIKMEHLLGLLPGHPVVYNIPFYPIPEAMFKFGVSWMFFD